MTGNFSYCDFCGGDHDASQCEEVISLDALRAYLKFNRVPNAEKIVMGTLHDPNGEPIFAYTCSRCPQVAQCPVAFDPYNTNGDCLAIK